MTDIHLWLEIVSVSQVLEIINKKHEKGFLFNFLPESWLSLIYEIFIGEQIIKI